MNNIYFVTVTGINHYYGKKPFEIGRIIKLVKDPSNEYDKEAIAATMPYIDTIGYVANSVNTVFDGTVSAGRLYDKIGDFVYGRVMFVTSSAAIVLILDEEDLEDDEEFDEDEEDEYDEDEDFTPTKKVTAEKKRKDSKKSKNNRS